MKKFFKALTNKWLLKGTTTILLVAIVIAGYIGLNWGAKQLKIENLDFTTKKLYSLSDQTKERLKELENDITIQLINMKDYTYGNLVDGNYVIEYTNKYTIASNKIVVEEINDLEARNDIQNAYGITADEAIIVVKNGEKETVITPEELVTVDYTLGKYIDKTEEAITNAIMEVTLEEKPQIYAYNGNTYLDAEQSLYLVATSLMAEANEVKLLDILTTGKVPEECDCLIMTTLSKDITELERDEIIKYINNGGKILMLTSQSSLNVETPNFNEVLNQYGITLSKGVVYEQDADRRLSNAPYMIVADASASFMENIDMDLKMFFMSAGNIQFADETKLEELGVTYETVASTSETSFVRTEFNQSTLDRTDKDSEEGACIVGAHAVKKVSDDKQSELIIYSDEMFVSTASYTILQIGTYGWNLYNNEDVVLNSISYLTQREDTITIRKTDEAQTYTVTEEEDVIIKTIIFTMPVLIIIIGISVWIYRRRRV